MSAAVIVQFPAIAAELPAETWMGIYIGETKIGYTHVQVKESDADGFHLSSTSHMRLRVLGEDVEQNLRTNLYTDSEFRPVRHIFELESSRHKTVVTARFSEIEITAEIESDGLTGSQTIPIPPGSKLLGDTQLIPPMKVGEERELKQFDPVRLILDTLQLKAVRKESLDMPEGDVECLVIEGRDSLGESTYWQDKDGRLVRVVAGLLGFTMIRESADSARSMDDEEGGYHPPVDLAVMTSAGTDVDIPNPREIKYLRARISGLKDEKMAIEDARQKVVSVADGIAEIEITAFDPVDFTPPSNASALPGLTDSPDVSSSPYIQSEAPEIIAKSREIIGDETDPRKAVYLLREWVHANMRSKGDAGILRSSVDILNSRVGVCRDYAILYTALARAAGIPSRPAAGLMYWDNGFYYHAWAESYIGEWIPVDPTLPTDFVDATHIKLTEGDDAMFDLAKAIGVLQVEVLEAR